MSDDWIKLRMNLWDHPKLVRIMSAICPHDVGLPSAKCRIIGALARTWQIFDVHTENGELMGYTDLALDREVGIEGWSATLRSVGWLESMPEALVVPRFEEHNGKSAKRRAEETKRKRKARESANRPQSTGQLSATDRTKSGPEKEKEKEKDIKNLSPAADAVDYAALETPPTWSQHRPKILAALADFNAGKVSQGWEPVSLTRLTYLIRSKHSAGWSGDRFLAAVAASIAHNCRTIRESRLDADPAPPGRNGKKPERTVVPFNPPPPFRPSRPQ